MNCLHWLGLGLSLATASYAQVIVNAGAFEESRPVAPNSLVAFGEFAEATPATANTLPLPVLLGGVEVLVGGEPAGIYSVSKTQVNFVIPAAVPALRYAKRFPVVIRTNGGSPAVTAYALIQDVSPAILVRDAGDALRPAAAFNADLSQNGAAKPARSGELITLFLTGDGGRGSQMNGGAVPEIPKPPTVYFHSWPGETILSSPAPGQPGLWLVKVRVPQMTNHSSGATPITVLFDGVNSNTATVWVQ